MTVKNALFISFGIIGAAVVGYYAYQWARDFGKEKIIDETFEIVIE